MHPPIRISFECSCTATMGISFSADVVCFDTPFIAFDALLAAIVVVISTTASAAVEFEPTLVIDAAFLCSRARATIRGKFK